MRLLPAAIWPSDLPAVGADRGHVLGLDEDFEPVCWQPRTDQHLLIFGEEESGKTTLLANLLRQITAGSGPNEARFIVFDARRRLLELGYRVDQLIASATTAQDAANVVSANLDRLHRRVPSSSASPQEIARRAWWGSPADIYLVVDDYDRFAGSSPLLPLLPLLDHAEDVGLHLIIARQARGAGRALYDGVFARLRDSGSPAIVLSSPEAEGVIYGKTRAQTRTAGSRRVGPSAGSGAGLPGNCRPRDRRWNLIHEPTIPLMGGDGPRAILPAGQWVSVTARCCAARHGSGGTAAVATLRRDRPHPADRPRPADCPHRAESQLQPGDHVHDAAPHSSSGTTVRPPLDRIAPTQVVGTSGDQPGRVQRGPRALARANGPAQSANSPAAVEPGSTAPAIASRLDAERGHVAGTAPEPDPDVRLVRLSIRTVLSRVDVVLPERCTFAEVLETILDLSPQSLRDNAVGHGGWVLRTAAGRVPDGDSTLSATGVLDGATLFLVGVDPRAGAAVYDDIADAVAESVVHDPTRWSLGAQRAVTLGAAGLFAALAILAMLLSGPPWPPIALLLAAGTAAGQVAAGLLSRIAGDRAAAVVAGLVSVVTGAAAAIVATAGQADLADLGTAQLFLGAAGATVCAGTAALIIRDGTVPMAAVIIGGLLTAVSFGCGVLFDLTLSGCAAITVGLSMSGMPMVPAVALRWAAVELPPVPTSADGGARGPRNNRRRRRRAADQACRRRCDRDDPGPVLAEPGRCNGAGLQRWPHRQSPRPGCCRRPDAAGSPVRHHRPATSAAAGRHGVDRRPDAGSDDGSARRPGVAVVCSAALVGGSGLPVVGDASRAATTRPRQDCRVRGLVLAVAVLPLVVGVLGLFRFVHGLAG